MELPPSLQRRIDLFRETGNVYHVPTELFAENSWIQVMTGQGIVPKRHHPLADVMGEAELARFMREIREGVDATVRQLPAHMDYLRGYCPGERPQALPA